MKKLLKYMILIAAAIFSSCGDDYLMINQTIKAINKMAKNEYDLDCFGSGFAGPKLIESFMLSYRTIKLHNISEARRLIVDLTESYLNLLNCSKVKFNMADSPISEQNAWLSIIFKEPKGDYQQEISSISIYKGYIYFYRIDNKNDIMEKFAKESYSEAYFKVYGTPPPERD